MLIKNSIYIVALFLDIVSVICLVLSIKTKNKFMFKNIIIASGVNLIYSILNLCMIGILSIPIGFELLTIGALSFISGLLYILAIFISVLKRNKNSYFKSYKKIFISMIAVLALPLFFFMTNLLSTKLTMKTSELIVIFDSDGNGGIGDSDTFAYAIKENSCKQFDLGIDAYGADLKSNMPNDMIYIDDIYGIENSTEYKLIINDDESMYVYKNGNQVCELNKDSKYFNIEFNSSFYKK